MRNRKFVTVLALSALFAFAGGLSGCGDDDGGDSLPLSEVESRYTEAMCNKLMECPDNWMLGVMITNTQECIDIMSMMGGDMGEMFGYFTQAVQDGRAEYDGEMGSKCLDAIESTTCDEFFNDPDGPEECETTFTGLLADSESCRADIECAGGWCDTRSSCPGECATLVAENGSCEDGEECEWGFSCIDGTCVPSPGPLAEGEECDFDGPECAYGLFCDEEGSGECIPLKGEGEECYWDGECERDKMCLETGCTTVTVLTQVGDECDPENEARVCDFFAGLVCQFGIGEGGMEFTECVEAAGEGQECFDSENSVVTPCDMRDQLYCDFQDTATCLPKKAGGEECEDNEECISGWCEMDGTCASVESDECY